MTREEILKGIRENGLFGRVPNHEIEELMGIRVDDFDARKRRHGYPDSNYYKAFNCEQAGKEKILIEQVQEIGLNNNFVFWKASYPGKKWIVFQVLVGFMLLSIVLWTISVFRLSFIGTHYCVMSIIACGYLIWLLKRINIYSKDGRDYYERKRREEYPGDIRIYALLLKNVCPE